MSKTIVSDPANAHKVRDVNTDNFSNTKQSLNDWKESAFSDISDIDKRYLMHLDNFLQALLVTSIKWTALLTFKKYDLDQIANLWTKW